jgi:epoxyqueuosine reductase
MELTKLTEKVKEVGRANNLDYVGIAPAELLHGEPERRRPADYLPGAQTVVSLGIRLCQGVQLANKLAYQGGPRHSIYSYLWHGFGLPSLHYLDRTAFLISRLLENEGYIAVPVMATSSFDIQSNLMEFSNLHAAVAAGVGEIGWSGLVMTPEVGPRARFSSVITTAKLKPDSMYDGPKLCNVDSCKELGQGEPLCARVCPTNAIGPDSVEVTIGEKRFAVAKFARFRCMWGSMGLTKDTLGLKDIPIPDKDEINARDVFNALGKRDSSQILELMVIGRGDYCGKCIMECPVGSPQRVNEILRRR